ncbi:MAG: homogentisate 1,2-dioxygenase [Bacteriovoracaceae bacterium]|nr:homogentisate 1,2-dioxygenase [Bacteriovoracaceae bacterium]
MIDSSFRSSGIFSKQAHVKIPDGLYEEEHGRKGFFGRVSHLYHEQKLTSWKNIEGDLKPRALPTLFDSVEVQEKFAPVLYNSDVILSYGTFSKTWKSFWRNGDFDELYFVHDGSGKIETTYGHINIKKGDYIIIPRGTTIKFFIDSKMKLLRFESNGEFEEPTRGILGPNALYDQTMIFVPEAALGSEQNLSEYLIEIKREGKITKLTYAFNPLDVKGWKGNLYPWKLSIYDYCPINSHKYHIPPSGHTTFVSKNFVICSFVARPLESSKEQVLKVPFYHSNIDYDEVLFYHEGDFFSRDNISAGALTFHPQGINHGPHPKAFQKANNKEFTDEYAVMLDARHPLLRSEFFSKYENQNYWKSWMEH